MLQAHCGLLEDLDGFVTPPKSPNFPLSTDGKEGVIGSSPILGFLQIPRSREPSPFLGDQPQVWLQLRWARYGYIALAG